MRTAFSDSLVHLAESDPKVLLLTGDHGYALFDAFRKVRPAQYINCGIAEQNMVGVAAGLAKAGFKPIVYGLAAFVPIRVLEQIKIDVCYENLPVTLIGDGAGVVYSHLGTSHQSTEDIAALRAIPEISIYSPADRFELSACMTHAYKASRPAYIRMGKADLGDIHSRALELPDDVPLKIINESRPGLAVATGSMVSVVKRLIEEHCLDFDLVSVPTIKPMCLQGIKELSRGRQKIYCFEEHSVFGGLGSAISEILVGSYAGRFKAVGIEDRFSQFCGDYQYLMKEHGLDPETIKAILTDD